METEMETKMETEMETETGNLRKEERIKAEVEGKLGGKVEKVEIQRERRMSIYVTRRESFKEVLKFLKDWLGITHLSAITGLDLGDKFEVLYHLFSYGKAKEGVEITVKVSLPKTDPKIVSIVDLLPGAVLYEREIYDMFGIVPEGHPDLRPLLLPDDWAETGGHPLRKDWVEGKEKEEEGGE